jgi:NAD(P)-dependent dehydrogenase (short-subunit alcohol dehydrogenase family)
MNLKNGGAQAIPITENVTDPQSVESMVKQVLDHFSDLHIAFNNAEVRRGGAGEL